MTSSEQTLTVPTDLSLMSVTTRLLFLCWKNFAGKISLIQF